MLRKLRPVGSVVLKCWVTETKLIPFSLNRSIIFMKSSSDRERRSISYTTITSTFPASTSASRRCNPGRSMLEPENPPSSYGSGSARQPCMRWLSM